MTLRESSNSILRKYLNLKYHYYLEGQVDVLWVGWLILQQKKESDEKWERDSEKSPKVDVPST